MSCEAGISSAGTDQYAKSSKEEQEILDKGRKM